MASHLTRAQRFNSVHAPRDLPPGGMMDHPGLYGPPRGASFEVATRQFQHQAGVAVDGCFGAETHAAFLALYGAIPAGRPFPHEPPPNHGQSVDLQVWVAWGVLDDAECRWLKRLGVSTLIFNLNKAEAAGRWEWFDGDGGAQILKAMHLARSHGFRVIGMVWAWRHATFNRQAVTAVSQLHARFPLDGVQFDVEGSWVHSGKGGRLTDEEKVDQWWGAAWRPFFAQQPSLSVSATPLYFLRPSVDALLDEPEMEAIYPQAYSPWLPGSSAKARATQAASFRAPALQRRAMRAYCPFRTNEAGRPVRLIGGIGGFHQRNPNQTPTESMLAQAKAFVDEGAEGLCLWALHTIQVGKGRAWEDEAEHRAAWERICLEYGPGGGATVQQPHAGPSTEVPQEVIADGVILLHGASWWQRLPDPYKPPLPPDHKRMGGKPLGRKVYQTATHIREMGQAEGTYLPFVVDGEVWCAVTCRHTHTHNDKGEVVKVPGGLRAVTVFKREY